MDRASIEITAPPETVYDLVADVTAMGRWSPETYRTTWIDGAGSAIAGARFRGWNRAKVLGLPARWRTTAVVRRAHRGAAFSFDVPFSGTRWTYRFEPTPAGCTVTETREVISRPLPTRFMHLVAGPARTEALLAGMEETLRRLKAAAEAETGPSAAA